KWAYKRVDCTDFYSFKQAVQETRCDALVHLAVCANIRDGEGNILDDTPEWVNTDLQQVHNSNVAMSYNALSIAADLGIERVVLASSVNSIGMLMSKRPKFDYLPLDENHPFYPEDAYSLAKHIAEIQSDAFARRHPRMRIATLRFHAVLPDFLCSPGRFPGGTWKDLWGWVSLSSTAKACLLSLITPEERFPRGHETFFIVASTTQEEVDTVELIEMKYPELIPWVRGGGWKGRQGLFTCEKAKRLLGWE
ncbi:hypothetical protein TREMEDRAFT_17420, partial [Tremella mesenterica DSM 1558]|uniref:uncharacterized protein n=1 Tax=Tremella mesenterica (strain ATCC 24925 / CBS 8224 / DSM 1558 / NBRC 9311 / NRRL Y-6157 / RJB 2259-6 / UBC 559-6) TaxID=578456 RepID=UPI0003F49C4E